MYRYGNLSMMIIVVTCITTKKIVKITNLVVSTVARI